MSTQDDALIFGLNPANDSLGGEDDSDDQTEDPTGKGNSQSHTMHSARKFDSPRLGEQQREVIPPLELPDLPQSTRIPLTRLTPGTQKRDRDLYRGK